MSSGKFRRVNVLISHEQYQAVHEAELSLSGLVRDLLADRFSQTLIMLSVSKETKQLYDSVISNFGSDDRELEPYLLQALDAFMRDKVATIETLREKLKKT